MKGDEKILCNHVRLTDFLSATWRYTTTEKSKGITTREVGDAMYPNIKKVTRVHNIFVNTVYSRTKLLIFKI